MRKTQLDPFHFSSTVCWGRFKQKSCSGPKISTAWKNILYRSKITLYWNPRKSGMYYEFSKNDILLMQHLKALEIKGKKWKNMIIIRLKNRGLLLNTLYFHFILRDVVIGGGRWGSSKSKFHDWTGTACFLNGRMIQWVIVNWS